jgi:hypothetical protein
MKPLSASLALLPPYCCFVDQTVRHACSKSIEIGIAVDKASILPRWYISSSTSDLTCSQESLCGSSITLWAAKTVSKPIVKPTAQLAMTILLREKVRGKEKPPILLKSLSHGFFSYFSQLFVFFAHSLSSPASSSSLWSLSLCTASSSKGHAVFGTVQCLGKLYL